MEATCVHFYKLHKLNCTFRQSTRLFTRRFFLCYTGLQPKEYTTYMNTSSSILTKPIMVCLLASVCCALWGSAYPCVKLGYGLFGIDTQHTPSILLFAGMRFFLAGILAVLIGSVAARRPLLPRTVRTWRHIGHLSLLQTIIQYVFFYIGLANTTGVKASIIGASSAFVALLIAAVLFRQEQLSARKLAGCAIGFAGVVLVNLNQGGLGGGFHITGEGFIFLSTISYAFSSVFLKRYSTEDNPVLLSGWQFVVGGAVMMACGGIAGGHPGQIAPLAPLMLFYLGCISAVAYSLWGILLKYNPVSRVTVFSFMTPVFGVLLSALLLQENAQALGPISLAALVLVCAGIYTVNRAPKMPPHNTLDQHTA